MTETEIADLTRAISSVRSGIKKACDGKRDADDYRARAETLRAELEAAKLELQTARDAQAAAKATAESVAADRRFLPVLCPTSQTAPRCQHPPRRWRYS